MGDKGFSGEPGGPIDTSAFSDAQEHEEKRLALLDPGPTWKEWLYFTAFRWWMGVLFLIVDCWIIATFLIVHAWLYLAVSVAVAIYLEYLIYGYFWRRPDPAETTKERRSRWPPWEVGRWTPEGFRLRSGQGRLPAAESGPDPREFL